MWIKFTDLGLPAVLYDFTGNFSVKEKVMSYHMCSRKHRFLDYTQTNYYLMELQPVGVTVREGSSQVRSQLRGFDRLVERFHGSHNVHLGGAETKRLN